MKNLAVALGVVLSFFASVTAMAEESVPAHQQFPGLAVYSKSQLAEDYTRVLIVDARTEKEFGKLHIRGAINIPVNHKRFVEKVNALRKQSTQRIVFYSNGQDCHNAYQATQTAIQANVKNVFVYDAGVHEWKKDYPWQVVPAKDESSLLQPVQVAQQL